MTRSLAACGWVLAAVGTSVGQPAKLDAKAEVKAAGATWEVRLPDGKVLKVAVLDDTITLDTAFGPLKIPSKDVRRIDFGIRYTDAEKKRIELAVADVTAADPRIRERGKDALVEFGPKAYPLVLRLSKKVQTSPHLIQVLDKLKAAIPEADETLRDYDLILTADESKFAGTLTPDAVRVKAGEAEKELKLADARVLVNGGSAALEEKIEIVTLPQGMVYGLMQTHFEKVVGVQITGRVGGSVWGTGQYTTDSDPGTAAVHAGVLKVGETAVVKIKVKADAGGYQGSTQNGVTTGNWGQYQGCYEILGKVKQRK